MKYVRGAGINFDHQDGLVCKTKRGKNRRGVLRQYYGRVKSLDATIR